MVAPRAYCEIPRDMGVRIMKKGEEKVVLRLPCLPPLLLGKMQLSILVRSTTVMFFFNSTKGPTIDTNRKYSFYTAC